MKVLLVFWENQRGVSIYNLMRVLILILFSEYKMENISMTIYLVLLYEEESSKMTQCNLFSWKNIYYLRTYNITDVETKFESMVNHNVEYSGLEFTLFY